MAKQPDWARKIIDRHTRSVLAAYRVDKIHPRERERQVRDAFRGCIRDTIKVAGGEMQGLIQDELEKVVPRFTTEEAARKLGLTLSTFRLYIQHRRVTTPDKVANTFFWSDEQIESARKEIKAYRASIRRGPGARKA